MLALGPIVAVAALSGPPLRVTTYNILAGKRGIDGIVETLRGIDADVIALQEVDRNTRRFGRVDEPKIVAEALGLEVAFVRHRRYEGGEIGVALLSRFPISDVRREQAAGSGLAMLSATIEADTGPIRALVLHTHPTDPRDPPERRARMDALRQREVEHAAAWVRPDATTVVLGDFNALPTGSEHAAMATILRDACAGGSATWPSTFPVLRIDYVWTSDDLLPVHCSTPASAASDHLPVVVDLRRVGAAGTSAGQARVRRDAGGATTKVR